MLKWKIYLGFLSLMYLVELYTSFTKPNLNNILDVYISFFSLVALSGFCFKRKIFFKKLWEYSFFMCIIIELFNMSMLLTKIPNMITLILTVIIGLLLVVPVYYAFYQYAFKSIDLWNKD